MKDLKLISILKESFEADYSPGEFFTDRLEEALYAYMDYITTSRGSESEEDLGYQLEEIRADVVYEIGKLIDKWESKRASKINNADKKPISPYSISGRK